MPLTIDLDSTNSSPSESKKNTNSVLAITTSNDTVTIQVNPSWPRVVVLRPTTDASVTVGLSTDPKFPIASGAALHLEISSTTVFNVSADSSSGNLHVMVLR
jgi:hypothetical protein